MDTPSPLPAALAALLTRHSVGPRHLLAPGPDDAQLRLAFAAALRAPDHGKRVPFRFRVAREAGLERLADLFVDYGRRRGKPAAELELERRRAQQAPVVIAVIARIAAADAEVPAHEQWIAVGGALTNVLNALHAQGFGAKMLSGARAADPLLTQAFCGPGETLVGWISAGTPAVRPAPRGADDVDAVFDAF